MPLDNMAPGMGVTYADLARLRKPEIPGQALRPGLSAGAAIGYGQDQRAFEGMINQAMPLAEQDAQMKMQAGQEWTQGAEARGLSRQAGMLKDQQAITEMQDPSAIAAKIAEKVAKLSEAKRKELEARSHIFAGLSRAKTPEDFTDLLDYYGDEAIVNGKSLKDMSPERAKALATGITEGLKMTPRYQQAMDVGDARNRSYQQTNRERIEAQERRDRFLAEEKRKLTAFQEARKDGRLNMSLATPKTIEGKLTQIQTEGIAAGLSPEKIEELQAPYKALFKELHPPKPTIDFDSLFSRGKDKDSKDTGIAAKAKKAFGSYDPKKYEYREYNGEVQRKLK